MVAFRSCWEICCWRWDIRAVISGLLQKQFIPQASIAAQLDEIGLSEASMLKKIRQTVKQKEKEQSV